MIENEWRAEHCPDYGLAYCECPFIIIECEGAWYCPDIEAITEELITYYDTNGDGSINPEDMIDEEHLAEITAYCDYNNDGSINACEVHACLIMIENEWRAEYCDENFG
jgi:hypothetical protein